MTTTYEFELIAENGEGDSYSRLERRSDGAIVLTTNADERRPVTPYESAGWPNDTSEMLDQLEDQFASREAAEIFAQAAGIEIPTVQEIGSQIGNAIARDVLANDLPREWTGLDPMDADQIPKWMDRVEVEAVAKSIYDRRISKAK